MAEISDLSGTDASNTGRFPENQAPSTVNDGARALEGMLARAFKETIDGALTTAGSSTAYTCTLNRQISAWYTGLTFAVKWHTASGATPTINPTGSGALGAKSLYWSTGTQVTTSDLPSGGIALLYYDGTNVQVLTASSILAFGTAAAIATALGLGTASNPQFATIELGHASDTTFSRVSAGVAAIEGKTVATLSGSQNFTAAQGTTDQALTDGATITLDASLQNNGYVVLAGNRTLGVPTNLTAGKRQSFEVDVYQDSTGSRTLAYAWVFKWAGGTAGTLTTTALARDKLFGQVCYYGTSTVTITIATPGVVSWTAHGRKTGDQIQFTTTGALPTGLTASTTYFVIKNDADSFWLATSRANAAAATKIATSGTQSGTHTAVACEIDLTLAKAFS